MHKHLTTFSMDEPFISKVFLTFSKAWRVSGTIHPAANCVSPGFLPITPDKYNILPTLTACE